MIDGGYFLKRLPQLVNTGSNTKLSAAEVAEKARYLCKRHVLNLTTGSSSVDDAEKMRWLDHVYRLFYYDALPYKGTAHHPLSNQHVDFGRTETARFRLDLFNQIRKTRKFALRLGHVVKDGDWRIDTSYTKTFLQLHGWLDHIKDALIDRQPISELPSEDIKRLKNLLSTWGNLHEQEVSMPLRQKGVDMRIGLDISTMALKQQVDTIILVTGDSDFVPAAKLARREGVEFLLDPLWQKVSDDLLEHVDGIVSALAQRNSNRMQCA